MALIIGLTGGIASGKSTVSQMFKSMNIPVIDADVEARDAVQKGEKAYDEIIAAFGSGILMDNGEIDRGKLGAVIFHNEEKRLVLNSIVHPAVREKMNAKKQLEIDRGNKVIVLDIPLLFESKLTYMVDKTLVVYVDEEIQLKRLMARNQLTEDEALARINSQLPLRQKVEWADEVINNNGSIEETREQLLKVLKKWEEK